MNVNYPSIKAAMKNAGYPVSTGDGWNGKDAAAFRAFSQFVIGVDHSQAHVMTTMPLIYKDQLEAVGIEVPGSDGTPVVQPAAQSAALVQIDPAAPLLTIEPISSNAPPALSPDYSFEVTGAKPEAADDKQSDAAPAADAVEQAATPPKVASAVESTGEGEKAAENAVLNQNEETRNDLEQAEQDERDGDDSDLGDESGNDTDESGDEAADEDVA